MEMVLEHVIKRISQGSGIENTHLTRWIKIISNHKPWEIYTCIYPCTRSPNTLCTCILHVSTCITCIFIRMPCTLNLYIDQLI